MRKFRFKLQPVLDVRKLREDSALRALGEAQRAHQGSLSHKNNLSSELTNSLARREWLGQSPVEISLFHVEQLFIDGLKQKIIRADQAIARASRGVEKAMRSYLAARKQTKAMEILRDKQKEEFRRDRLKAEQKSLDDLLVMRERLREEAL